MLILATVSAMGEWARTLYEQLTIKPVQFERRRKDALLQTAFFPHRRFRRFHFTDRSAQDDSLCQHSSTLKREWEQR